MSFPNFGKHWKRTFLTEKSKHYDSVDEMLRGIGMDSDYVENFNRQVESETLSAQLQQLRVQAGLTQLEKIWWAHEQRILSDLENMEFCQRAAGRRGGV